MYEMLKKTNCRDLPERLNQTLVEIRNAEKTNFANLQSTQIIVYAKSKPQHWFV
jgi:hypothetical protein